MLREQSCAGLCLANHGGVLSILPAQTPLAQSVAELEIPTLSSSHFSSFLPVLFDTTELHILPGCSILRDARNSSSMGKANTGFWLGGTARQCQGCYLRLKNQDGLPRMDSWASFGLHTGERGTRKLFQGGEHPGRSRISRN